MPTRIQRRRSRGWRKPEGAKYVGRGTRYGNPWAVVRTDTGTGWGVLWAGASGQQKPLGLNDFVPADSQGDAHALAVELFEVWVHAHPRLLERARTELAGADLMCWCREGLACHGDSWLLLANGPTP